MRRSRKLSLHAAISLGAISVFTVGTAGAALALEEFTVVTETVQSADIDVDDDGEFSQGDQSVFADVIVDDEGKEIGRLGGVCTATKVESDKDFETQCQVTYHLSKGQITVQGLLDADDFEEGEFTEAVTGGTGIYKNVSGEVHVELTEDGSEATFDIDLNE